MKKKNIFNQLIPVMLAFFVMGFVDLVGIATNYVKVDFDLSDTIAGLFPSMVFLWFLLFSIPTGILMNKIGRQKTVLISLIVTSLALFLPSMNYSFAMMLVSFALLGIGNTILQVSLNPLLSDIVSGNKLASSLTLGQFIKAIASFLAPLIAGWAALGLGDWRYLFPIFLPVAVFAIFSLGIISIAEKKNTLGDSTFKGCFSLLKDPLIFLSFIGIICHVGVDVGFNLTAPKLLMERLNVDLTDAGIAASIYFLFRTIGCFIGAFILLKYSSRICFFVSTVIITIAIVGLFVFDTSEMLYICIALVGLGNSNVFSMLFSKALLHLPKQENEVSGLMIMGLIGGAIFPLAMGIASDAMASQTGALLVLGIGALYLFSLSFSLYRS